MSSPQQAIFEESSLFHSWLELQGEAMPPDSHVSRTDLKLDGQPAKIYRRSAPFGREGGDCGLYFLAFSCDPARYELMLSHMFGTAGDGLRDRLTDFSRPTSGSYFFAPSVADLARALA
jgi:putative iron-dependent peroxidase